MRVDTAGPRQSRQWIRDDDDNYVKYKTTVKIVYTKSKISKTRKYFSTFFSFSIKPAYII